MIYITILIQLQMIVLIGFSVKNPTRIIFKKNRYIAKLFLSLLHSSDLIKSIISFSALDSATEDLYIFIQKTLPSLVIIIVNT